MIDFMQSQGDALFEMNTESKTRDHFLKSGNIHDKDPGRSKYNHTSMESLVDVEYKYIRVNIVFPFHKLQDAERTSHCPPPPSYVTYLVRLAETLMTSFRVGVARDVRPLELLWLARARRVNGFCTQSQ